MKSTSLLRPTQKTIPILMLQLSLLVMVNLKIPLSVKQTSRHVRLVMSHNQFIGVIDKANMHSLEGT